MVDDLKVDLLCFEEEHLDEDVYDDGEALDLS